MKFTTALLLLLITCLVCCWGRLAAAAGGGDQTQKDCEDAFQKVMTCLDFARGKTPSPTKECCSSVEGIKEEDPKCLCFIIQQTNKGVDTVKSLGIQEAKLLQLPSACHLKNASVSNCPLLLGLPPSSPDAAIFTRNSTSPQSASSASSSTSSTPSSRASGISGGSTPGLRLLVITCLATFFLVALPMGSATGPRTC